MEQEGDTSDEGREGENSGFRWSNLPPEVQLEVIELLSRTYRSRGQSFLSTQEKRNSTTSSSEHRLANYASVCRHWNAFFQKLLFHSLIIRPQDLALFVFMYARRLDTSYLSCHRTSVLRLLHVWRV